MASKKFQDVELVNQAGDTRTATSPAQYAQFTFDGFYVDNDAEVKDQAVAAEAEKTAAQKPAAKAGNSAPGEKTVGSNPS